jgi:putative flippase GtrA
LPRRLLADRRFVFLLVGGFNVVQGFAWFTLFNALLGDRLPYLGVLVLAYLPAILIGFVLYRTLVFNVVGHWVRDLARFTLVQAVAFLVNVASLPFFHEILGVPIVPAQALSVIVIVVFSYFAHLYFSFRRTHGHPDAGQFVEPEFVLAEHLEP